MFLLGIVQMNGLSVFNAIYSSAHLWRDAENLTAPQLFNFHPVFPPPKAFHSADSFQETLLSKSFCFISSSGSTAPSSLRLFLSHPPSVAPCLWARQVKTVGAADRIRLSGRFNHKLPAANKACGCNYYTGSQSHLGPARLGETFQHAEREQTEPMGRVKTGQSDTASSRHKSTAGLAGKRMMISYMFAWERAINPLYGVSGNA